MREYTGDGSLDPIQPQNLSERVAAHLLSELVGGRLRQGDRINEVMVARNLGISRNPVREGMKRLEERGFLVTVPYKGMFVRSFSRQDVDDIFEFRKMIESFAIERALKRMGKADLATLSDLVDHMVAAAKRNDIQEMIEYDLQFHETILELGGNERAKRAFQALCCEVKILIAFVDYTFDDLVGAVADHIPVLEALKTGDVDRSVAALLEHLDDAHNRLVGLYESEAESR